MTDGATIRATIREHAADEFSETDIASIVQWCAAKHELDGEQAAPGRVPDPEEPEESDGPVPDLDNEPRPRRGEEDD